VTWWTSNERFTGHRLNRTEGPAANIVYSEAQITSTPSSARSIAPCIDFDQVYIQVAGLINSVITFEGYCVSSLWTHTRGCILAASVLVFADKATRVSSVCMSIVQKCKIIFKLINIICLYVLTFQPC
jgi:hypothetical protein